MQYIWYSLFFYFILFFLIFAQITEPKTIKNKNRVSFAPFFIILIFLSVRIGIGFVSDGHPYDMQCFSLWAERLAEVGPRAFYAPGYFADYPPGYMLVLYVLGWIGKLFQIPTQSDAFALLVKLPSIFADAAIGYFLYRMVREKAGGKNAAIFLFLFLLNPVLILNSAIWGQIDSFFTLFLVLSVYMLYRDKHIPAAVLYAVCTLIKPQSLIFGPVFLCAFLFNSSWRIFLKSICVSILTFLVASVPFFGIHLEQLIQKYWETLSSYQYATVNAFNLYILFGMNWAEINGLFWSVLQIVVLAAITLFSIWFYIKAKHKDKIFYMAYLLIACVFTVAPKMHERYIFPALVLIFACYLIRQEKRLLWLFLAQTIAQLFNTGLVYITAVAGNSSFEGPPVYMVGTAILNLVILYYSVSWGIKIYLPQYKTWTSKEVTAKPKRIVLPGMGDGRLLKKDILIMLIITLLYGFVAIGNLGDMQAPQIFYFSNGNDVIIDLKGIKPVGKLMLYEGIGNGQEKLTFMQSSDGVRWSPLMLELNGEKSNQDVFHPSFVWKHYQTNTEARFIKLGFSMTDQMIGEMGVFSPDGELYEISAPMGGTLADEQHVVPKTPSYLNGTYFDEIYHARTAYEMVHGMPIYETTHPPLGKILISWGILLFGMVPFGWRIMGTLFGTLMLPVLYIFIKKISASSKLATGGTILFAADFMHFSLTRIATIDSFVTLFIMLSYLFLFYYFTGDFYKRSFQKTVTLLGLSGLFFGLSVSTKWIGVYAALGLALLLALHWFKAFQKYKNDPNGVYKDFIGRLIKTILICILFFAILPLAIYFLSYLPQMQYDKPEGQSAIAYVLQNQAYMLQYHGKDVVEATHPFSSSWISWLVVGRPLWAYTNNLLPETIASTIVIMGNPLIWWTGLVSMLSLLGWFAWRDKRARFLLIAYLAQLMPWFFVERTTFIYHYFSCVPFMIIAICYVFEFIKGNFITVSKYITYYYLLAILLFVLFYPALSGYIVSKSFISILRWFPSWNF